MGFGINAAPTKPQTFGITTSQHSSRFQGLAAGSLLGYYKAIRSESSKPPPMVGYYAQEGFIQIRLFVFFVSDIVGEIRS